MSRREFVIAKNPEPGSSLPYLIRLPLGEAGVVLKARDTWPRTAKVYCHRADGWPADPEIVERVPVRSCIRRGAAVDLVLERSRENRSQIVFTRIRGGRDAIFWQSARTARQARPNVGVPRARSAGGRLTIVVDVHERYPWKFTRQQADTVRRPLPAGDYALEVDGDVVAAVERKTLVDLVATLTTGKLRYLLADLASLPRAAVVVEDRYSSIFRLDRVRPALVADGVAEAQVRFPAVPVVFCENRQLAQEWTYRFLGAAVVELAAEAQASELVERLPRADPVPAAEPTTAEVRAWATAAGLPIKSLAGWHRRSGLPTGPFIGPETQAPACPPGADLDDRFVGRRPSSGMAPLARTAAPVLIPGFARQEASATEPRARRPLPRCGEAGRARAPTIGTSGECGRRRQSMMVGMTPKSKIAISLPPELVERAHQAVAQGRASSVSAYVADAIEQKSKLDDLASLLDEMLAHTGGPLTAQEAAEADRVLGR